MKQLTVSRLHCQDCSHRLIAQLERLTGRQGFAYDGDEQVLTVPEGADMQVVCEVLSADKIAICHDDGAQCACVDCRFPTQGAAVCPHDEPHEHALHEGHAHSHAQSDSVVNIAIVFAMNLLFSAAEFVFGAILNSTAIFADAVHDLGDAFSVGLALVLEKRSRRHADGVYSFGHRRFSLLGALATGLVLVLGSVISLARAVPRLLAPGPVNYDGMLVMALVAIALNAVSAWALRRGHSRNEGMLNLHMLEDMAGWIGILIMSLVLRWTNWYFLDPMFSVLLSAFILYKAVPEVWGAIRILMESVPENVSLPDLERRLLALPHVHGLSHLHLWSMDGEHNTFAVSLFTDLADPDGQRLLRDRVRALLLPYSVECSTVEIDYDPEKRFVGRMS